MSFVKSSNPSIVSPYSNSMGSRHSLAFDSQVITYSGLPILESPCSDPSQWRIERVSSDSSVTCWSQFDGKRCNAKIAKYRRSITAPTFLGIERHSKSKESRQVQVWFSPLDSTVVCWGQGQSGSSTTLIFLIGGL